MHEGWSKIDVLRKTNWATKCWLNSAHSEAFPSAGGATFGDLVDELNHELGETKGAFKHDRTTTVKAFTRNQGDYVLKRYNARSIWHVIKRALRTSRAQRCWCMSFHFQRAGLNVAEPIMMLESRAGPITKDAYLICALLQGQELLTQLPTMQTDEQEMVRVEVETALNKMSQHLITHGDMKASNLLWVEKRLFFIDLDAAKKHRNRHSWQHASKKDRKRFLKNWRAHPELLALFADLD